jgi:L-fucose isomerase-like protein
MTYGQGENRMKLNIGFLTTYSGRWPKEVPEKRNREYAEWLKAHFPQQNIIPAEEMGSSHEAIGRIIASFAENKVDVVIMLYGAFTGDDVSFSLSEMLRVPLILWAPYEEPFRKEERLFANALCSMTMNSAALRRTGTVCHTVYGSLGDERAEKKVSGVIMAYQTIKSMRYATLGLLGYRPTAFYNCAFDEGLIRKTFGVKIEETDLKVVFDKMQELPADEVRKDMEKVSGAYDVSKLPENHLENHAKLYLALKEVMKNQNYDFGTIKCWPEMGNLHTTPCAVLGRLADDGINIGCEGDVDAELTQMTEHFLTGKPTFITDMINIDEQENIITFWHCGNPAPSLFNPAYGSEIRNHPLAGQGTAFYGSLKPGKVTVARFCNIGGQYKLFLLSGEAVARERNTKGAMAFVRVEKPVRGITEQIISEGVPHHYSIVWEDVAGEMKLIASLLNIPVIEA